MHAWDNPRDPSRDLPPGTPETPDSETPNDPAQRPPFDRDPEAQRAPGGGQEDPDTGGPGGQPPMQAAADDPPGDDELTLDAPGAAREPVGNDNIREGRVGGVMGPPHATNGQGQGG
jgi:hypothetical protein